MYAKVAVDFGIVVREGALDERGVSFSAVLKVFDVDEPLDRGGGVLSFGPHYGAEAAYDFTRDLEALGLVFGEDFLVFDMLTPPWCSFGAAISQLE